MEYKIVSSTYPRVLEEEVNKLFKLGWGAWGNPFTRTIRVNECRLDYGKEEDHTVETCQAMIRYAPIEPPKSFATVFIRGGNLDDYQVTGNVELHIIDYDNLEEGPNCPQCWTVLTDGYCPDCDVYVKDLDNVDIHMFFVKRG